MATPNVFEYEVWLSTHDHLKRGVLDAERRKYLVAADTSTEGYQTALAMAWRGDWQVTKVWWVP
ncbi:hypothetical protein [Actinophytocola sediminis]